MTITITQALRVSFFLLPKDMEIGHAYADKAGRIYVCNSSEQYDIAAFSVCGRYIVLKDENKLFREVNLEIIHD
jgi:hypothetical protein